MTTWSIGGVFGPIIVSVIKESTNSYIPVFYVFTILIFIAFLISMWMKYDINKMKKKQQVALQSEATVA